MSRMAGDGRGLSSTNACHCKGAPGVGADGHGQAAGPMDGDVPKIAEGEDFQRGMHLTNGAQEGI